jgi:hypothetical protein
MAETHAVALYLLDRTPRAERARTDLAAALPGAEVTEPDELGVFEARVEAADKEGALQRVWDAMAAAGADDHVVFLEHPELPEHWRARAHTPDTSVADPTLRRTA